MNWGRFDGSGHGLILHATPQEIQVMVVAVRVGIQFNITLLLLFITEVREIVYH
jgi:hypothetical protein